MKIQNTPKGLRILKISKFPTTELKMAVFLYKPNLLDFRVVILLKLLLMEKISILRKMLLDIIEVFIVCFLIQNKVISYLEKFLTPIKALNKWNISLNNTMI